VIKEPTRNSAPLNLMLTKKELVGDMEAGHWLGGSDHKEVEFRVQRKGSMAKSRTQHWISREQT